MSVRQHHTRMMTKMCLGEKSSSAEECPEGQVLNAWLLTGESFKCL